MSDRAELEELRRLEELEAKAAGQPVSNLNVVSRAANRAIAGTADMVLNAPTNLANLGLAGVGSALTAAGKPEWAPEPLTTPDLARKGMEAAGFPLEQGNLTPGQKAGSRAVEFATSAMMGGGSAKALVPAAASGAASSGVEQATNSPTAGFLTALALPAAQRVAASRVDRAGRLAMLNAERDKIAAEWKALGGKLPPSVTNPTPTTRTLGFAAGEQETAGRSAEQNFILAKELAAKDLNVAPKNLNPQTLKDIRVDAGKAYDAVKAQVQPFQRNAKFDNAIADIEYNANTLRASFPQSTDQFKKVDKLVNDLRNRRAYLPEATVEKVRQLRRDATNYFRSDEAKHNPAIQELAVANKKAADALEGLIEDNLQQRGLKVLLDDFKKSRTRIAQTYTVEEAMDAANRIHPLKLAAQMEKGVPLTGNLQRIARAASVPEFKESFDLAVPRNYLPLVGRLGAYGALGGATTLASGGNMTAGGLTMAALMAGTPALLRPALTSNVAQRTIGVPSYQRRIADALANQSVAPLAVLPELQDGIDTRR